MAETAVCNVIDKLALLLTEEINLLGGVHSEVAKIKSELESIQSFLKSADGRAEKDTTGGAGLKTWVKQVREVAYHMEDVIDNYMLHVAQRPTRHGFIGFLHKISHSVRSIRSRHEIASEILDIKANVREIKERCERYALSSFQQGSSVNGENDTAWHDPRVASLFIGEAEVVGIESTRDLLIGLLIQGADKRTVIAVMGMGGLGKTTLAKKVYDNQMLRKRFNCRAWITVSQSYKTEELLRDMIKQFYRTMNESAPVDIGAMGEVLLISKLREYLQEKRFLVVFDDIWLVEFWGYMKLALPDNDKGSRIIITTRSDDVAASCKESPFDHVYRLQPLPPEKAWELFCKKVFQSDFGGCCPPELEKLSLDIVKKCEGLPLAIVAIGGLLSTKNKVTSEWQKLHDGLGAQLECNPRLTSIAKILSLSYHDLPYYLKSCFLYFAKFPEDYSISCVRLVRLWIAEGFVKGSEGKTLEQMAEEYLTELIHRSLVQVSWVNFDGKVRSCRVHDLMREIILSLANKLSFCQSLEEGDSTFDVKTRRLSIHNCTFNVLESVENSRVRSISIFKVDEPPKSLMTTFLANFKLLKVLDFEDAPLDYLPEEVGNLFLLRYLSIRDTKVKILPKSIGKLRSLETLDLKRSLVCELPVEINRLLMLRHLLAYGMTGRQGVKIKEGFGCLEALQKLLYVEAKLGIGLIKEMGKLRQLRKLGITKLSPEDGKDLCASIEKMNHLESLDIYSISRDEVIDLQSVNVPPQNLLRLCLKGRLEKLPGWIPKLLNVVKIHLCWSRLMEDPVKVLQALPNLLMLELYEAYDGDKLHFEEGGFRKLELLQLMNLNGVKSMIIDEGALPSLKKLTIGPSQQLKEVPSGIHYLRSLETLIFYDMPTAFIDNMRPQEGRNYWIVEHVPSILVCFKEGIVKPTLFDQSNRFNLSTYASSRRFNC